MAGGPREPLVMQWPYSGCVLQGTISSNTWCAAEHVRLPLQLSVSLSARPSVRPISTMLPGAHTHPHVDDRSRMRSRT